MKGRHISKSSLRRAKKQAALQAQFLRDLKERVRRTLANDILGSADPLSLVKGMFPNAIKRWVGNEHYGWYRYHFTHAGFAWVFSPRSGPAGFGGGYIEEDV